MYHVKGSTWFSVVLISMLVVGGTAPSAYAAYADTSTSTNRRGVSAFMPDLYDTWYQACITTFNSALTKTENKTDGLGITCAVGLKTVRTELCDIVHGHEGLPRLYI